MPGLPKIVSSRMRQQTPGQHLDPDLLSAFVEQRLRVNEREAVLAHLGGCAECREVVRLAAPAVSVESPALMVRSERKFRIWQWSAVAASMVVVGIAVWLSAPEMMMRKAPQQAASVSEASRPNAPRAPSSEPEMELRAGRQQEPGPAEIDRAAQSTQSVATLAERGKKPQTVQDEKNSRGTLYDITPSRKREEHGYTASGAMMGGAVAKTSDLPRPDQKADVQEKIALAPSAPSSVARPRNEPTRESAEETPNGQAVSTADTRLMAANRIVTEQPPAKVESKDKESSDTLKQAQKRNEPAAVAELSMAQGSKRLMKSKPPTTFGFFPAVRLSGDGMLQQQELGRNDRWRDLKIGSGEPLRALALRGNEIWVGGDKGVLYRSADGGKTWTAVDLQLPDQVGVVALKFRDLMHGELTTTTGERWISEDGGVSWKNAAEEK